MTQMWVMISDVNDAEPRLLVFDASGDFYFQKMSPSRGSRQTSRAETLDKTSRVETFGN